MIQSSKPLFVFLSYSPADSQIAARLRGDLQAQGIQASIDQEGIQPGTPEWQESLRQAIRAAQVVLFIASPQARSSPYVKDELRIAEMYRRPICPIWVAGSEWMEAIPLGWGETQYIDARGPAYETALPTIVRVVAAAADQTALVMPSASSPAPIDEPRNPYKGLRAFTQKDAADFFGRDVLIDKLVAAMETVLILEKRGRQKARLLAIIGPNGSGKSSVAMAGLLPRLQHGALPGSEAWIYLEPVVPGRHPIEALAVSLAYHFPNSSLKTLREDLEDDAARGLHLLVMQLVKQRSSKVVLLVDQFEEVFTLTFDEAERQHFLQLLVTAVTEPGGPLFVILTLGVAFYDPLMHYPELYRLIGDHHVSVSPIEGEDLRSVIEQPANLPDVQLTFEGGLVDELLFQGQIVALSLLEFTLAILVDRRNGHLLTLKAYREIGGIKGALSQHAEQTYQALPSDEHRQMAREVFLRLVKPGTTKQDTTRRRVVHSEFELADPVQARLMQEVLGTFLSARLLTSNRIGGKTSIEVSHEALIWAWPRLADWLHEAGNDVLFQQSLSEDAEEWERRKRPREGLYRGDRLKEAQAWARRNRLSKQEMTFLRASNVQRIQSYTVALCMIVLLLALLIGVVLRFIFHS